MPRFRQKPLIVEAVQWNGYGFEYPMPWWLSDAVGKGAVYRDKDKLFIRSAALSTTTGAAPGFWLVWNQECGIFPVPETVFNSSHEALDGPDEPKSDS